MSSYMRIAATAAERLERSGVEILSYYDNGRRPVLIIRRPPAFVTGHMKQRHPNGQGGHDKIFAASYFGTQLEWVEHCDAAEDQPVEAIHA